MTNSKPYSTYYNVLSVKGDKKTIDEIVEYYIEQHQQKDGYLYNVRELDLGNQFGREFVKLITEGVELRNYIEAIYDEDIVDPSVNETVYAKLHGLANRLSEQGIDLAKRNNGELLQLIDNIKSGNLPVTLDEMLTIIYHLNDINPTTLGFYPDVFKLDNDKEIIEKYHEIANTKTEIPIVMDVNDFFRLHCSFLPFTKEEFEDYRNGLEDIQSYNVIENGNEATLIFSAPTKNGPLLEVLEDLVNSYEVTGSLYFGDGNVRGEFIVVEEDGTVVTKLSKTEPTLNDIRDLLDSIGQLDNAIDYFGWTQLDIYPELDDSKFVATMPTGGID